MRLYFSSLNRTEKGFPDDDLQMQQYDDACYAHVDAHVHGDARSYFRSALLKAIGFQIFNTLILMTRTRVSVRVFFVQKQMGVITAHD